MEQHPFTTNRWFNNIGNPDLQDKWINKEKFFAYIPNREIKSIFLGTFPIWQISTGNVTPENFEFFYGSRFNDFWNCLGTIFNVNVNHLENRLSVLNTYELGITDILKKIDRNPENSNQDKDINALIYNDILALKNDYHKVKNIFITSGGKGPINNSNKNAGTWFKKSLNNQIISGFNQNGFVKEIEINDLKINLIYLYSPSNSANTSLQRVINDNNNFGIQNLDICTFRRLQWGYFLRKFHLEEHKSNVVIENIWNQVMRNEELLNFFDNND